MQDISRGKVYAITPLSLMSSHFYQSRSKVYCRVMSGRSCVILCVPNIILTDIVSVSQGSNLIFP